jgi:hypothetical protein
MAAVTGGVNQAPCQLGFRRQVFDETPLSGKMLDFAAAHRRPSGAPAGNKWTS